MSKKAIGPLPKKYSVGRKSKVVYSDTDESDYEDDLVPNFIVKPRHKPDVKASSNIIDSETSAVKKYAKLGIQYPGGKRKTRRSRRSSRKTKRHRSKK